MDENKPQEIVVVSNQPLTDTTDDIIASAERRIANVQRILELALKITNENDWIDQSGKPYLVASGAEKVARLFGVSWKDIHTEKVKTEDEKGPFYFYQVRGLFTLKSDSVLAIGTCSSKDQFFAKRKEKTESGESISVFKELSEIDETNIMKAAYTNCVSNGVTRLLGLRNLTWEQVSKSGITRDKVATVKYAAGGAGGGKVSEPQVKRLFALLNKGKKTPEQLKEYLKTAHNLDHTSDIDRKDYEKICAWAEGQS